MSEVSMTAFAAKLRRQQFRQDLHDVKYHTDIYVLPKAKRLTHLVLHHCKYVSDLYLLVNNDKWVIDDQQKAELLKRRCLDGLIVCLSMANICGKDLITSMMSFPWVKDGAVSAMIETIGKLAKTIEDIDHMGQTNPIGEIYTSINTLAAVYAGALSLVGIPFQDVVEHIHERLLSVESKHMWHSRYLEEIDAKMYAYDQSHNYFGSNARGTHGKG